jgi:hypothetical protein
VKTDNLKAGDQVEMNWGGRLYWWQIRSITKSRVYLIYPDGTRGEMKPDDDWWNLLRPAKRRRTIKPRRPTKAKGQE